MHSVYLNGRFIKPEQAVVSVYDRGFLFAEGVYEVIAFQNQTLIDFALHEQRLKNGLQAMGIKVSLDIQLIFSKLIKNNSFDQQQGIMYIHITRGGSSERSHAYNEHDQPCIYCDIKTLSLPTYPKFERFKVITLPDYRWSQCHIKSTNLIANTMAYNQALSQGAVEAILHRDRQVVEGSKSNVFMVKNNTVITPPLRSHMLGGTVRKRTLELLRTLKIPHHEANISVDELRNADELWITSTTRLINPITQVDDHILTRENFGLIWHRVNDLLQKQLKSITQGNLIYD